MYWYSRHVLCRSKYTNIYMYSIVQSSNVFGAQARRYRSDAGVLLDAAGPFQVFAHFDQRLPTGRSQLHSAALFFRPPVGPLLGAERVPLVGVSAPARRRRDQLLRAQPTRAAHSSHDFWWKGAMTMTDAGFSCNFKVLYDLWVLEYSYTWVYSYILQLFTSLVHSLIKATSGYFNRSLPSRMLWATSDWF